MSECSWATIAGAWSSTASGGTEMFMTTAGPSTGRARWSERTGTATRYVDEWLRGHVEDDVRTDLGDSRMHRRLVTDVADEVIF